MFQQFIGVHYFSHSPLVLKNRSPAEGLLAQFGDVHLLGGGHEFPLDVQAVVQAPQLLVRPLVLRRHRRPGEAHKQAVHIVLAATTTTKESKSA